MEKQIVVALSDTERLLQEVIEDIKKRVAIYNATSGRWPIKLPTDDKIPEKFALIYHGTRNGFMTPVNLMTVRATQPLDPTIISVESGTSFIHLDTQGDIGLYYNTGAKVMVEQIRLERNKRLDNPTKALR